MRMERLIRLNPSIHLNKDEVCSFTGTGFAEGRRPRALPNNRKTSSSLPEPTAHGTASMESRFTPPAHVPAVVDTIGAGDAHCGAFLACLSKGMEIGEAIKQQQNGRPVRHAKGADDKPSDLYGGVFSLLNPADPARLFMMVKAIAHKGKRKENGSPQTIRSLSFLAIYRPPSLRRSFLLGAFTKVRSLSSFFSCLDSLLILLILRTTV